MKANIFISLFLVIFISYGKTENNLLEKHQNNAFYSTFFGCPTGWVLRCEKCYLYVDTPKPWTDAQYYCKQLGGNLVTIQDFSTNFFLSRYVQSRSAKHVRNIYIGLNDRDSEGNYKWADETPAIPETFRWLPGEPSKEIGSDCVEMFPRDSQYLWNDVPCTDSLSFVCQMSACVEGSYRCDNGRCISQHALCDNTNDCGDFSDERNCSTCGGYFTNPNGTFTSPDYPNNYGNNRQCSWIIEVEKNHRIILNFTEFEIEAGFDFVEVFDGQTLSAVSFGRFHGDKKPNVILSTGSSLRVTLISDVSTSMKGFVASWVTVLDKCGEDFVVPKDGFITITSPNYPSNYPNDKLCEWKVTHAEQFKTLTLTFEDLNTESKNDVITIKDGGNDQQILGTFSGVVDVKNIQPIFSTGQSLYIKFQSNFMTSNRGFKLLVRAGCYAKMPFSQGIISSPGYPIQNYPRLIKCIWDIEEPNSKQIGFRFHHFDTEKTYDFVNITGKDNGFSKIYSGQMSSGNFAVSWTTPTNESRLTYLFNSDVTYTLSGFNVSFSIGCENQTVSNGRVQGQTYYGGRISYQCDEGFYLVNGKSQECLYGGKWSQPQPFCKAIDCGHPGLVDNGGFTVYPLNASYTLNTRVNYYCDPGYELEGGDVERFCGKDSKWNGTQPLCKVSECEPIRVPKNGKIYGDNFRVGSKISFTCDEGFNLKGVPTLICGNDGNWNAKEPTCEAIFCPPLNAPWNSDFIGYPSVTPQLGYGTEVEIKCVNGYEMIGNNKTKCVAPGLWQPGLSNCVDKNECETNPCKGNGSKCVNLLGSYECRCMMGYERVDNHTCQDIDECLLPSQPIKCSQTCTNELGSYKCSCDDGYYLYDGDNSTLNRVEKRTAVVNHTCLGVMCPFPTIPKDGYITKYGYRYPAAIEYHCNRGSIIKGDLQLKCQQNGTWDKPFPECIVARCRDPTSIPNASFVISGLTHDDGTYKIGSNVTYSCNNGYERSEGNLLRECVQNATHSYWSGDLPSCKKISCPVPNSPENGGFNSTGSRFEDMVQYTCDAGFILIGATQAKCQADGKWSEATPVCAASTCPRAETPDFGEYIGKEGLGSTIQYRCYQVGFTLIGDENRTCLYNATSRQNYWNGTVPACKDITNPVIDCPPEITVALPRSENSMLVNWTLPTATDTTFDVVIVTSDLNLTSPAIFEAGKNRITYTARDKAGNRASCDVVINIVDKEIPQIQCPPNVEIKSDFPVQVFYGKGLYKDNDGIKQVQFQPSNGSMFASDKYHSVKMIVEDKQGNIDTCIMEVYVKGCGCASERNCSAIAPQNGGISTCHVNTGVTVCALTCPNGKRFVKDHFNNNLLCTPQGKWNEPNIPGCGDVVAPTSCYDGEIRFEYSRIDAGALTDDDLPLHFTPLVNYFNKLATSHCSSFNFKTTEYKKDGLNITITIQFSPKPDTQIIFIKKALTECEKELEELFVKSKTDIVNLVSTIDGTVNASNIASFKTSSCCDDDDDGDDQSPGYCCPTGHTVRSTGQTFGTTVCLACSSGMYYNATNNKCLSCPLNTFTSTLANTECTKCPEDSQTLNEQSTECIKKCPPGSYSSTGLQPTCRLCDYGQYQEKSGMNQCNNCTDGLTTTKRGSINVNECKAPCDPGTYSSTGLKPCDPCGKGTYQSLNGRSTCQTCPTGVYGGKEGATSVAECPTTNACDQKLCQNDAQCIPGNFSYTCQCPPGFTSKNCDVDINECESSPCRNNGTCTNAVNNYTCTCPTGITGGNCEVNIDDCKNDTCLNNGLCEDLLNDFKCACPLGYEGKRCESMVDHCKSTPCQHNSSCTPLLNDYRCNCTAGYEGKSCETEIDECKSSPCLNNANCTDRLNGFECTCQPGFIGKLCAVNVDECSSQPCQNNATCNDGINDYTCECKPGYTGKDCEINVNECETKPCLQNSTCIDLINKFQCNCEAGFYGDRCEFEVNECESFPCKNNASCTDKVNDYKCVCPFGFTGKQCETNINECDPNPCQNGTCTDLIGDYVCDCSPGFEDRNCSTLIDNCQTLPCQNNATCTNQVNNYTCNCLNGYEGRNCEINTDECNPDPCNGNALNCTDLIGGYICYCKPGFKGDNCSEEINNCLPDPCMFNSTCKTIIETNDFFCNCTLGYEGKRCENETNECLTLPCKNNATCIDQLGDYSCACPTGYTGKNCETNINDCENVTCLNDGSCIDKLDDYVCQCPPTHKGRHCEKKIPNEVDIKLPGGKDSVILHSNISTLQEFSLSVWVRYLGAGSKGVFLILANMDGSFMTSGILKISHSSVIIEVNNDIDIIQLERKLNDGLWHHVFVSLSGISSKCLIRIDNKVLVDQVKTYLNGQTFFNPKGLLIIGKNANQTGFLFDSGFTGEISQIGLWNKVLPESEVSALALNCTTNLAASIIPWVGLLGDAGPTVELVERWTCGVNVCPAGFMGKFCEIIIDKIPPEVVSCPSSKKVITMLASTRVEWDEPVFKDNIAVVSILRSHTSGQAFSWGDYVVSYIAKDAFNNSAICIFELYVTPHNCPSLTQPSFSLSTRGTWLWGEVFDYQCQRNYELAVPKPPFYSCGKMGTWSHGPPTYPENPNNLLPSCTELFPAVFTGTNSFAFTTTTCDERFQEEFVKQFKAKILQVHQYFKICGETCDFSNLRVVCNNGYTTFKTRYTRDTTTPAYDLQVSFDLTFKTDLETSIKSTQETQAALKDNKLDLSLSVDGKNVSLMADETTFAEPKLSCEEGKILKNQECVNCPSGTYRQNSMTSCQYCQVGYYSSDGSSKCQKCDDGLSTNGVGARNKTECYAICDVGEYLHDGRCFKCEEGFYKDVKGFSECIACPLGTSTRGVSGATNKTQCHNPCNLGEEFVGMECKSCLIGYYRDQNNQTTCIACPAGTTTYQNATNDRSLCFKKCNLGFEVSADGTDCVPCTSGYYRESPNDKKCTKCSGDKITQSYGANNISLCTEKRGTLVGIALRFTSLEWNVELKDEKSVLFRKTAYQIIKEIVDVYKSGDDLVYIQVTNFTRGSVVANMVVSYSKDLIRPIALLERAISDGDLNGLAVDSGSLVSDRCIGFTCPKDQICWSNETNAGCKCRDGFYITNTGTCAVSCTADYCLNNGKCFEDNTGRTCRCLKNYSGKRCEKGGKSNIALILGLVIAAFVIIIFVAYCLFRQKRFGNLSLYKQRRLDEDNMPHSQSLSNMGNTPLVQPANKIQNAVAYDNNGAYESDGEEQKVTVTLKTSENGLKVNKEATDSNLEIKTE